MHGNHCFGCGADNDGGLRIKSYWLNDDQAICRFKPASAHSAAADSILNGGIIATLIDCHSICTAVAHAYRDAGREIGTAPTIWYATGALQIKYLKPTALSGHVELIARVTEAGARKTVVHCELSGHGEQCVTAEVVAVRVPDSWLSSHA